MSENKITIKIDQGRSIQLRCECGSLWHNVGLEFIDWGDDQEPELYIQTTHGNYLAWHKRIWEALKYVCSCVIGFFAGTHHTIFDNPE